MASSDSIIDPIQEPLISSKYCSGSRSSLEEEESKETTLCHCGRHIPPQPFILTGMFDRNTRSIWTRPTLQKLLLLLSIGGASILAFLLGIILGLLYRPDHGGVVTALPAVLEYENTLQISAPPLRGPDFPHRLVTFRKDPDFMFNLSHAQPAWDSLLTLANWGQIAFDPSSPATRYGISAWHQMHCVYMMQRAVDMSINGTVLTDHHMKKHMWHCVEYLRQAVMCHADATIEKEYAGLLGPFEANNTHICRDWDALMTWAEKNVWDEDTTSIV